MLSWEPCRLLSWLDISRTLAEERIKLRDLGSLLRCFVNLLLLLLQFNSLTVNSSLQDCLFLKSFFLNSFSFQLLLLFLLILSLKLLLNFLGQAFLLLEGILLSLLLLFGGFVKFLSELLLNAFSFLLSYFSSFFLLELKIFVLFLSVFNSNSL